MSGISFMVRIRDEEKTLRQSILSLQSLTIPHEIVLILHLCKDKSEEIAKSLQNENPTIRIYTYDKEISRAGYENLATNSDSPHSFVEYANWCFKKLTMPWVFKWDADFLATPELIQYLNSQTWERANKRIRINAKNNTNDNREFYLCSGLHGYGKYVFWEVPIHGCNQEIVELDNNICILHCSELSDLKQYWSNSPWYTTEDSQEAMIVSERIQKLIQDFGMPPEGMARAGPMHSPFFTKIMNSKIPYVNFTY